MNRRKFLSTVAAVGVAGPLMAQTPRPRRILLRSSWQTENIGDIAHTPGVLALIEKHLPGVEVRLWPSSVRNGVKEMLLARFPKLVIVQSPAELKTAFAECDFLLHGSGPSLVATDHVAQWVSETGKPFGVYGITLPPGNAGDRVIELLSKARFVYFRDSVSLEFAKSKGVKAPIMAFGPDGAFAVDLRNDAKAESFLKEHDLHEAQYLCCIPRYRRTPYWSMPNKNVAFNQAQHDLNEKMKEHDHAPMREAIVQVVRQTDMKVLICPEDESQVQLGKEMLYDKLPDDIKKNVVWRSNFWLTDEALSTYVRSAGLFGNEMHSPIMSIGNGIPAIVCRWDTQTSKGFMWRDIGLHDWLIDFDKETELEKLVPTVLAMAKNPVAAKEKARKAGDRVRGLFAASMVKVKENLG